MTDRVTPGLPPRNRLNHFTNVERQILRKIGEEWRVTHSGGELRIGKSGYRYCLIKPTALYQETFNLDRELLLVFSPYEVFQPRTMDAFEAAAAQYQRLRLDQICWILVSKDPQIEEKLSAALGEDHEASVVIPFTYAELSGNSDIYLMRNRFRKHFFSRDLFGLKGPLRKETYFFGMNDLVHSIANRHKANENAALFGLRKTGKTSAIFGVKRALSKSGAVSVVIDGQNPAFHRRRWNAALWYVVAELSKSVAPDLEPEAESAYTEVNAAIIFEREILRIHNGAEQSKIVLIFDEIENVTFGISPSSHWAEGLDYVYFWQAIRAVFQKLDGIFSFFIVGTNAMCTETPTIGGKDNPLFNLLPIQYIPRFSVAQTEEMVRTLGRTMGLQFDDILFGRLTEDYGGHPFLMRQVCSTVHRLAPKERPVRVDKTLYETAKTTFNRNDTSYFDMILTVLKEFYPDEYAMMEYLAVGDSETFSNFATMSPYYTNHLLGYGIIDEANAAYSFKIESIKEYLASRLHFRRTNVTVAEMWEEISARRNSLEPKLRTIVRTQLKAVHGEPDAKAAVLDIFGGLKRTRYSAHAYKDLFDPNKTEIYFEDLRKIILKHWELFQNIFGRDRSAFDTRMQIINKYRSDAHAKALDIDEMALFRVAIGAIEDKVLEYLE